MTTKTQTDQSIVSPTPDTDTTSNTDSKDTWVSWDAQEYADKIPEDQIQDRDTRNKVRNACKIDPNDVSGQNLLGESLVTKWTRLHHHDLDIAYKYRSDIDLSKRAIIEMKIEMMRNLGLHLGVSRWMINNATRELFRLDLSNIGYPDGIVGFCLYVLLYDEATSDYAARTQRRHNSPSPGTNRPYWPARDAKHNDESFQRVADNLTEFHSVTESNLLSILQKQIQGGLPTDLDSYQPSNSDLPSC